MARFRLAAAHELNVTNFGRRRLRAGTIICDGTSCNTGDVIVSGLNSATVSPDMDALDAGATTIKNASKYASTPVRANSSGVDSIDP
jgi:hypothetical protein